jgi:hypothetical protein
MAANPKHHAVSRRSFLKRSGTGAAWLVTAVAIGRAGQAAAGKASGEANPFAYDVSRLAKTDPKLIQYREVGRLRSPHEDARRIALGPDDQLYIAAGNYVSALDKHGSVQLELALGGPARALAIASDGDILVGLRDHVEVFDSKGARRASWDSPGPRTWLTGLATSTDSFFAADAGNRVVLRYDRKGKLVGRIGEKNKMRNTPGFIVPSPYFDLKMHRDGLLRVTNPGRHRVEAYTVDGDFEFAWGKPSAAIDGFCGCCNPVSIASLPDGRLVTCEKGLPRVKVYHADGGFASVVAGPESFPENMKATSGESLSDGTHGGLDAAVDSAARIYILDLVTAEIRIMTHLDGGEATPRTNPSGGA